MDPSVPSLKLKLASWITLLSTELRSTIHAYTRLARCPQGVGDLLSALKVSVTAVTALKGTSVPDCHTLALENSQWTLHYQELEGSSCFISFTGKKKGRKYAFSWPLTS